MLLGYTINVKCANGTYRWSSGRIERGDVSFGPNPKKVWKDLRLVRKHIINAIHQKIDISEWKVLAIKYEQVDDSEIYTEEVTMGLMKNVN